ncbi:hypothetical protein [Pseudomonas sp.]|uniref:hypothetical protein n=1 Tax=Pseudomonas sp. TaxID=306 RepID=UPI0031DEC12D
MNREDVAIDVTIENVELLRNRVAELEHPEQAEDAQGERDEDGDTIINRLRLSGLSIDGDNAYKRDLLDCVVGALAFGFQGRPAPDESHWLLRFWEIGNAEREARAALAQPSPAPAMRCQACNAPRKGDACHKCGGPLTEKHPSWEEPDLPSVDRIRGLAREVGYAVGVHGSLERDLDLIAAPWQEGAVSAEQLCRHLADGLGGTIVGIAEEKPLGRYAVNIQIPGWFKVIDLSVAPVAQAGQVPDHAEFLDWAEKVLNEEQERLSGEDYLMDSNDCIAALREAAAPAQGE